MTTYRFVGNKEEIKDLYDKIKSLREMEKPAIPNVFGIHWLGCAVNLFHGDPEKIECYGDITCLELLDENTIRIDTETAWGRMNETWDLVLKNYSSIAYYFYSEEPESSLYETNDENGIFFSKRFIIYRFNEGGEYYEDEEEFWNDVSDIIGEKVTDWEEMETAIDLYNSENEYEIISINKIDVIK
jgi:hypothetical protein